MLSPRFEDLAARLSDRLLGGPGAVANAARAVHQDATRARQREAVLAAVAMAQVSRDKALGTVENPVAPPLSERHGS